MTTHACSCTTAALAVESEAVEVLHLSTTQQALSNRRQLLASVSQFWSFTAHNPLSTTLTPCRDEAATQARCESTTPRHWEPTPAPREPYQWFTDDDGNDPRDDLDNSGNDNSDDDFVDVPDELDPNLAVFHNLALTINCLSKSSHCTNNSSSSHAKVRELDTFDGTDPKKLRTFLVQCELCFQDCPKAFHQDRAKVTFTQSYLKGMTLEWFELDLLDPGAPAQWPRWMDSWVHFVAELQKTFSPHDPVADAEHQLKHLTMRDNHWVMQYIINFNRLTSQVWDYGDGTLHCLFYSSLPDCLKDEITHIGKPWTLDGLCILCQEINARYWEHKDKISHSAKSHPSSSSKPSNSRGNSSKSRQEKSKSGNTTSSASMPGSSKLANKPASSTTWLDLTATLGKDGKLTTDEQKQCLNNNLCMFCRGTGHFADKCHKKAKQAKAHAAATATSRKPDSTSGASSKVKKE